MPLRKQIKTVAEARHILSTLVCSKTFIGSISVTFAVSNQLLLLCLLCCWHLRSPAAPESAGKATGRAVRTAFLSMMLPNHHLGLFFRSFSFLSVMYSHASTLSCPCFLLPSIGSAVNHASSKGLSWVASAPRLHQRCMK